MKVITPSSRSTIFYPLAVTVTLLAALPAALAAGNSALMQRAKQRAFKLNEQIFQKLEHMEIGDDSALSFVGRVVRNADGQLVISIDEVNTLPSRYRAAPTQDIQYITFEEMQTQHKAEVKAAQEAATNTERPMMGGGAAALK